MSGDADSVGGVADSVVSGDADSVGGDRVLEELQSDMDLIHIRLLAAVHALDKESRPTRSLEDIQSTIQEPTSIRQTGRPKGGGLTIIGSGRKRAKSSGGLRMKRQRKP